MRNSDRQAIDRLMHDALEGRLSRRTVMSRAAALGLSIPMVSAFLAARRATAAAADATKVRAGWVKVLQWTHWADVPSQITEDSVTFDLSEFKASNEVLVALTSNSLDMGTLGYNHVAGALARGKTPLTFVAGVSSGGSRFVAGKGVEIGGWDDLKGLRIGSARGSTQYMQLLTAMGKHGLDLNKDTEFTHLAGATDMNVALRGGNVDAIMSWEPNAAQAIVEGFGFDVPAIKSTLYSDSFKISSGIVVRDGFAKDHPDVVQTVMDAYYASWRKVTSDRQYWLDTFKAMTDLDSKVLELAAENAFPEIRMPQQEIALVANLLHDQGAIEQNVTEELIAHLNYDFIAKASGMSAAELGQGSGGGTPTA
jgi:NitT/TauT family transport system substrate-binding protein